MIDGIELPIQQKIKMFWEKETYRYLGMLEEDIKQAAMKKNLRRTRKLLKTKLKSHERDKNLDCPPCKILGTIL